MGILDKSIDTIGFVITIGSGAMAIYFAKPEWPQYIVIPVLVAFFLITQFFLPGRGLPA